MYIHLDHNFLRGIQQPHFVSFYSLCTQPTQPQRRHLARKTMFLYFGKIPSELPPEGLLQRLQAFSGLGSTNVYLLDE